MALHAALSLSLRHCWEKYLFKAMKKRCRWMLSASSFQKLLMNTSGYLSAHHLHIYLSPTSLVRKCKRGTTHTVLHFHSCNKTSCLRLLSSICNKTLNQPMHPALLKWKWLVLSSFCALTSMTSKCSLHWKLCLWVVTKEYFLLFKSTQGYRSST